MIVNTDAVGTASHLPALAWALSVTDGPVLEFGGGLFSTGLLWETHRASVTVECEPEWRAELERRFPDRVVVPALTRHLAAQHWGVVFIDHGLGEWAWIEERAAALRLAKGHCDVALVHDWHIGPGHRDDIVRSFRYFGWFAPADGTMHTALCSDTVDVRAAVIKGGRVYWSMDDAPERFPN